MLQQSPKMSELKVFDRSGHAIRRLSGRRERSRQEMMAATNGVSREIRKASGKACGEERHGGWRGGRLPGEKRRGGWIGAKAGRTSSSFRGASGITVGWSLFRPFSKTPGLAGSAGILKLREGVPLKKSCLPDI
jgi:hypothetical protein